jgi:hypothetical protein
VFWPAAEKEEKEKHLSDRHITEIKTLQGAALCAEERKGRKVTL